MTVRGLANRHRWPRAWHTLVGVLIVAQGALLSPLFASELMARVVIVGGWSIAAAQAAQRRLPSMPVRVNRTVPRVTAPDLRVQFAERPTTAALTAARVFSTPLVPVGGDPSLDDNAALARTLELYAAAATRPTRAQLIEDYLAASPASPWRPAVALNLGTILWREGYFRRAARYWEEAWDRAKGETAPAAAAIADSAIAELVTHHMTFGQLDRLEARLQEVGMRPVRGGAGSKVDSARMGAALLRDHHEAAVFSGPAALLGVLDKIKTPRPDSRDVIRAYVAPHEGTTLVALRALASSAGLAVQMRRVTSPAEIPIPAVVHLKSDHYSAVIDRTNGAYVLRDAALGGLMTLSEDALADEMSGYLLVPDGAAVVGQAVDDAAGERVVGHCAPGGPDPEDCGCPPGGGMPVATLNQLTASVNVGDTPLSYSPPVGPGVSFHITYNQRTARLAQVPTYSNVGPLWSHDWLSWVEDNNTSFAAPYSWEDIILRGSGVEQYNSYDGPTYWRSRATVVKVTHDPPRYERTLPDGAKEIFTFPDRGPTLPQRRVFLTEVIDPQGHALTFTYDAQIRLVAITDAIGQVTTVLRGHRQSTTDQDRHRPVRPQRRHHV